MVPFVPARHQEVNSRQDVDGVRFRLVGLRGNACGCLLGFVFVTPTPLTQTLCLYTRACVCECVCGYVWVCACVFIQVVAFVPAGHQDVHSLEDVDGVRVRPVDLRGNACRRAQVCVYG